MDASTNRPSATGSIRASAITSSNSRRITATKEQYANAIASHTLRSKENFLFTGVNYVSFSQFVNFSPPSDLPSPTTIGTSEPWPYLVVHIYGTENTGKQTFDNTTEAQTFLSINPVSSKCSQVVFMRGFPSPDWLNTLGAHYKVNPEFFRRHLDFMQHPTCYDLPALPSSSSDFVNLKITTISARAKSLGLGDVQTARQIEFEAVRKYQNQITR